MPTERRCCRLSAKGGGCCRAGAAHRHIARTKDLPPGAAHMSSTRMPGTAPRSSGGSSEAASNQYQRSRRVAGSTGGGGYLTGAPQEPSASLQGFAKHVV